VGFSTALSGQTLGGSMKYSGQEVGKLKNFCTVGMDANNNPRTVISLLQNKKAFQIIEMPFFCQKSS
jgi:hypothetical protein